MNNVYAALEIGTTRTVLAVGEPHAGRLRLVYREIPSTGVRKSQILDMSQAMQSVRSVLHGITSASDTSGSSLMVKDALLAVSGQHVRADHVDGKTLVEGKKIGPDDIANVQAQINDRPLPKGRELLDIAEQDFEVDSLAGILDPKGMAGRSLVLNTLHIHADANRIQDARTAAENAHLEISEPVFAATCAAEAVLDAHDKRNGALVLDLGGGSTGYAVYTDGYLATAGVIGVGGDHITNDIAQAFQTTNAQAERLKVESSSAMLGLYKNEDSRVRITGTSALMESRTIARRALDTVVNARVRELFTVIRETLEDLDLLHRLRAGIILTGGGANLRDIETLAEQELGAHCRKGRPLNFEGLENTPSPWSYAVICGALLYAQRSGGETTFLDKLFGRRSK